MSSNLAIRNMVCPRCITAVEKVLENEHIKYDAVQLGLVILSEEIDVQNFTRLADALEEIGFQIINDPKLNSTNKVKTILIELLMNSSVAKYKLSTLLSEALQLNYQSISHAFLEQEGTTIEKYFIRLKIEKVKELLSYNELSLKEVAYKLNYSSVAHLSKQFKKLAGVSPTQYRSNTLPCRQFINDL